MKTFLSVLLPSRERPDLAEQAIKSFPPSRNTEFLLAVDDDDPCMKDYLQLARLARLTVTPPHGYLGLHKYYNQLAELSRGQWLLLFNDDAVVEQFSYQALSSYDSNLPIVLNIWNPQDNLFPIISRTFYETIGHFSLSPHADSWVQQVGERAGVQYFVPDFRIRHDREQMHDATYQRGRDAIKITAPAYASPEMEALKEIDVNKIKGVLQ